MAETSSLLRNHTLSGIEGSNPSVSAIPEDWSSGDAMCSLGYRHRTSTGRIQEQLQLYRAEVADCAGGEILARGDRLAGSRAIDV